MILFRKLSISIDIVSDKKALSLAIVQQKVDTAELYFGLECPIRLGKR